MSNFQVCLTCNYENAITATHCQRCHAPLRVEETAPLSLELVEAIYQNYGNQRYDLPPNTIAMYLVGKGQTYKVSIADSLTLGRQTSGLKGTSFDLSEFHGRLLGVSRQHAVINCTDAAYFITDLDSTNGTWINKTRMAPNKSYRLCNGDQVRLGDLSLFVFLPA